QDEDPQRVAVSAEVSVAPSPAADRNAVVCAGLQPTFAEACALVQAPYSCLVMDTSRRHVALPPMYLKKKRTGIQQELNAELLKYSSSLKGVPLAYDHIKVLGQHGEILDDQGFIHLNIEASFVIFRPKKGEKLVGVINKMAPGHVGCLVHGCFNACVLKPAQLTSEQWRDSGLKVGASLQFEVFQLDADVAGVLLIRGRLEKSRVQELVASISGNESLEMPTETDSIAAEDATTEITSPSKPKKKKKKKDKERDMEAVEDTNGNSHDVNSNAIEEDPDSSIHTEEKKKKKKKKNKKQEATEEMPSPTEFPNSDSSGYISEKSSLKRKAQDDEGLDDVPVVKKKKKIK
ncbi:hypothetical protein NFI96_012604, partial [Prochilodus magdalenae]